MQIPTNRFSDVDSGDTLTYTLLKRMVLFTILVIWIIIDDYC